MQRSGTTSVGDWLEAHGLRRAGFSSSNKNHWTRHWLEGNFEAIFGSEAFLEAEVFEDDPWWCPEFYKVVSHRFPEARFVLLERPAESWFASLCAHSGGRNPGWSDVHAKIYRREEELQELLEDPSIRPEQWGLLSILGHDEWYKRSYLRHAREVKTFFATRTARLYSGPLEDPRAFVDMLEFLGIQRNPAVKVPHSNATTQAMRERLATANL